MSVLTETSEIDYVGSGATTEFPVPFPWLEDENLVVTLLLDGDTVATTQVLGTHYTLDGAEEASGTLTMLTAPALDSTLHIERTVPVLQETSFVTQGQFDPATHEAALDYRTFVDLQQDRRIAALEALAVLASASEFDAVELTKQFTTHATVIESTFPVLVALPAGFTASGFKVTRARNVTTPGDLFYEPVWVDWEQIGANISIRYCSGLDVNTEYLLTFEATGA